ncbi:right-handed parallel beta-helix repeat-containing protein [Pseudochryseolinea flava]|nr:right-handed parallel beta-helix repeat-containing protein [Pseudochryseolinea flava]
MNMTFAKVLVLSLAMIHCSSERTSLRAHHDLPVVENYQPSEIVGSVKKPFQCGKCTYVVPKKHEHDGAKLGLKPGDVICLDAKIKYGPLKFVNLKGTKEKPITIINCGGPITIDTPGHSFALKTEKSEHFRITSVGTKDDPYGIKISGAKGMGIALDYLSTNFEVDHVEVFNIGFAGIMAKTDPNCDDATIRGNFVMRDIALHDNYIHDTGGEGFYIGNSFYNNGMKRKCGVRFPHDIEGVKVFNNIVKNSGWESIQVGSAPKRAEVYNNYIENYGTKDIENQRGGIQIGEGTGGLCYNNFIKKGKGNAMIVLGYGDNIIFNNVIIDAGKNAIFCDERYTKGDGFKFINNTIINPGHDGILIYAELVEKNVIINNIIANPGNYKVYESTPYKRAEDAYVHKLNKDVRIDMSNNLFTQDVSQLKFLNVDQYDFKVSRESPAIDGGRDMSAYNINFDFLKNERPKGKGYDIGAFEFE